MNVIFTSFLLRHYNICVLCAKAGEKTDGWCSGEESCLGCEGATWKIGYTDEKACQLEVIAGLVSSRGVSQFW